MQFIDNIIQISYFPSVPIKVMILNPPKWFRAGKEYQLVCLAQGSRPPPQITWEIGMYNATSRVIAFGISIRS